MRNKSVGYIKLPKETKYPAARKRAKAAFQLYRRIECADENGDCVCCYCGRTRHYKQMQGAHYIKAIKSSVTFDDMNVHPACRNCNLQDDHTQYRVFMIKTYGLDRVERLELKGKMFSSHKKWELLYLEKEYKKLISLRLEEKSI